MKCRESGMPEESYWETLFDIPVILDRLEIDFRLRDVIELGCGYGTFTIPSAARISGTLTTCDIDSAMIARTRERIAAAGLGNTICQVRDVFIEGFGAEVGSQDCALLFNILHCEDPVRLLIEAARVVGSSGSVLVIHWRPDPATPRGPSMHIRPQPGNIVEWAHSTGCLEVEGPIVDLPPWHYGLRLRRLVNGSEAHEARSAQRGGYWPRGTYAEENERL